MNGDSYKHDPNDEWVDPYPKKKHKIGWITGFILLLAVYVLSTGPIYLLANKGIIAHTTAGAFCEPLYKLAKFSQLFQEFLRGYWNLWVPISPVPVSTTTANSHP
jgi:hypothetical protein